jgi:hypothetical protein
MNAASTAVVRRHVGRCVAWGRMVRVGGKGAAVACVTGAAAVELIVYTATQPRLAAAVRAKGVG